MKKTFVLVVCLVALVAAQAQQSKVYVCKSDKSVVALSDVDSITLTKPLMGMENGYEWVDLGLPSGTRWASVNVGATTNKQSGTMFAWGETAGKTNYSWDTYTLTTDGGTTFTKYNDVDGLVVLEATDDAATAAWGGDWTMPTKEQIEELFTCTQTFDSNNKVRIFFGPNGKSISLPLCGVFYGTNYIQEGTMGYYWTKTVDTDKNANAFVIKNSTPSQNKVFRNYGCAIRPVLPKL